MQKICNLLFLLTLSVSVIKAANYATEQPDYLPPCKIYEPEFVKCSTKSIQSLFKQLKYGIPGLKSLGSVDPFYVNKVKFKQDNSNVVSLSAELTKLVVSGFSDTIVKQSKVSKKDFSWETKFVIPKLRMDGDYSMDGRILLVPLNGKGKIFMEIANMDVVMYTKTRLYEKGDFTFYNVTNVRLDLNITGLKTKFENLFNGNTQIEDSTNLFFNENWQDFFEAMRPVVTQTVEEILLSVLQKVFHYIPANFFVSDIPTSKVLYGDKDKPKT